jgi:uncharacterized membrane protein
MSEELKTTMFGWLNPVVLIPLISVVGVLGLIFFAMLGWDNGVLKSMAGLEFTRGLITYLFAIVTIGTAVVLVVFTLSNGNSEEYEKKFQRGKEILSLLLGVFGTIVGFYFGSASSEGAHTGASPVSITPLLLSKTSVTSGERFTVTAAVSGGVSPFRYRLEFGGKILADDQEATAGGWIVRDIEAPFRDTTKNETVVLKVTDTGGRRTSTSAGLQVVPADTPAPTGIVKREDAKQ